MPNNLGFIEFSNAIQDKEIFFNPLDNLNQTRLKENCETILNSASSTSFSLASKLGASASHGAISGTSHAITAIALESAKSKAYTETQLRLLKAGSIVFNSLVIASYASIASYMENLHEPDDAIAEKMYQSFAFSLASTTSLYALVSGINYFAKSIENKLVKGFLNALPLAGNIGLLVKGGNSITESAAMIGTHVATAGLFTSAIQTGWNFFSKRRNIPENTDLELSLRSNMLEHPSASPSTNEEAVYAEINDQDEDGYMLPNTPIDSTRSTPPEPPFRKQEMQTGANSNYDVPPYPKFIFSAPKNIQADNNYDSPSSSKTPYLAMR